jgi:hypothetical protein
LPVIFDRSHMVVILAKDSWFFQKLAGPWKTNHICSIFNP